ncbi:MAG: RsmB/NOP family class I SAM-dependent RNA methyltransferase, partial [Kiritimatiellaeota bacterium]|nr:RsmB/NOP family class I SAM-dependent RNA methyltransferase [Kiritimatiellota bacterium]
WLARLLPDRWATAIAAAGWLDALPHPAAQRMQAQAGLTAPPAVTLADKARTLADLLETPPPFSPAQLVPAWVPERLVQPDGLSPAAARARHLESFQSRPPLWLRVAPHAVPAALAWLNQPAPRAAVHPVLPDAVRVAGAADLHGLRKAVGAVFEAQDLSSQCVGRVCAPPPGARWWDACAGAGGKTLHLAALMHNRGALLATDTRAAALQELRRRAAAAGVTIIRTPPIESVRACENFDGVLVDAPCSGLGTWNRNPDMRWRTEAAVVEACAATQQQLLAQVAPRVQPGGVLVYAVCTVTRVETTDLVGAFLDRHTDYQPDRFSHPLTGREVHGAAWVWPWDGPCGGMFIARLRRAGG